MRLVLPTICLLISFFPAPALAELPFLVGGMAHGVDNINALAELELGNFVWIPPSYYWESGNTPWDEEHDLFADVDACVGHGFHFMIGERRGVGDVVRHGGYEYGGHGSGDLHDKETVAAIVERGGDLFVGLHAGEMDADFVQNAIRPSFMTRVPHLYEFTDREGGRESFEGELIRLRNRYRDWGAKFIPNLCVTSHLSGFRIGAHLVIAELLEHLPTTELQLAYLRGGARQFGGEWGIWVSPWYRGTIHCEDKELWPMPRAQEGGGHSASALRRCLWLSYASGCRLFTAQETEPLFARAGDGGYRLAAWGSELKQLWDYGKQHNDECEPIISLAVMIDMDNGWVPAHLWGNWNERDLVWGKLPADRADAMLAAFLDVLLPGFRRTPESVKKQEDFYPGYFAATPHGPFDIVASDISARQLSEYPCVLLLGEVRMHAQLHAALKEYVGNGGTLILNALHMRNRATPVQDEELLGCTIDMGGKYSRIYASSKIIATGDIPGLEKREFDEPWFCSIDVKPTSAKVLATDQEGHPVLLQSVYGQGLVYLTTPEYMSEGYGEQKKRLNFFDVLLPVLIPPGPIQVAGEGDISWVAARRGTNSIVVVLANHGKVDRNAEIVWGGPFKRAEIEIGDASLSEPSQDDTVIRQRVVVPAEDVVLVRISTG